MPRRARIDACLCVPHADRLRTPSSISFIIVRGIERRKIFEDDTDRINFPDRLGTLLPETKAACYVYPV
ncbi:MAG TPA: hypothetical protein ENI07_13505 [Desulfobacterales bacterium]|nr:hypothetical protein [Desulfobacterales bacterium]